MLVFLTSYHPLSWFPWSWFGSSTTAGSKEEEKLVRKVDDQPSRVFEWEDVPVPEANLIFEDKHAVLMDEEDDEGRIIVPSLKDRSYPSELPIDLTFRLFQRSIYPIAYGGRSDIWKCVLKQDSQSCEVAVKSIRSHDLGAGDIYNKNEQLRPALKLRARVKHENILPLLGVATGFGRFTALIYPWMENGTLASYLQRNREQISLRDRLELLRGAVAGLCYLHSCSIFHGQLTGFNIFVSASGRAQLSGFGFSNVVMEFLGTSYSPSSMNGIVRWAAPEMLTMHDDESSPWAPTEQSDIYSLGSVMLQVCSGEVPYADLRSDVQVMLALANGVTPSRPATPRMNDRMWDFIQRCWSTKEQGAKRPSAEEALNFIQEEISLLCPIF
ncbi:kinase-like protein [Paxillus ammoniavirescens]|nr:kinase-like protein [Paxillus ammoniavirescens]